MAARQVSARDLDQVVCIQQRQDVANARGEPVPTWVDVHTRVFAQRQPLRGRELYAAAQVQTPADVRFRIRYRAGITPLMRVVHAGVPYAIVGDPIDVDGQRRTLELMCTTGVRDGR